MTLTIPLFPLKTVLFPGGVLPLRIFEHRYLEMVSDCLKDETGIGFVLIRDGSEVGKAADTHEVGTLSHIDYWHKRKDGLLGVTLAGAQRFKILSREVKNNQLIVAEVELIPDENETLVAEHHRYLVDMLRQIIDQLEPPYSRMKTDYDNANWVGARLVELLPIPLPDKQRLLLIDIPEQRLDEIVAMLGQLEV